MVTYLFFGPSEGNRTSTLHTFLNHIVQVSVSMVLLCNQDHLLWPNTWLSCQQAAENDDALVFSAMTVFGELLVLQLSCSPCSADTSTAHCLLPPRARPVRRCSLLELTGHLTAPHCAAPAPRLLSPCSPPICLPRREPVGSPDLELSIPSQIFLICESVCCCIHSFPTRLTGTPEKA